MTPRSDSLPGQVLDDSAKEESEAHVAEKEAQARAKEDLQTFDLSWPQASFEDGLNLLAQSEEKLRKTIADSSKATWSAIHNTAPHVCV